MTHELILTGDGSHTIFIPEMGEHYHSVHGAIQESRHIFIKNGYYKTLSEAPVILEIGFGTGLNTLLTILESAADNRPVVYESWEAYPIEQNESIKLNYPEILGAGVETFKRIHLAPWDTDVEVQPGFLLRKVLGDIRNFHSGKLFDLVYFDAFGPDYQPGLWTTGIFRSIYERMKENAILTTYSAKGQVRRNLREAGFSIDKVPGPPGKREITIATKI